LPLGTLAGQLVAMNDGSGLQYFLTDHLGSVVAVTDASGTLIAQQRYLPFGGERTDVGTISQTDYGYTGQRDLDSGMGGLMDYKARFYSPYLNRFIQPDTLIPDPANSQAWNRYAYVYGNPVRHTDPSGHLICLDGEQCYSGSLPGAPSWWQGGHNNGNNRDDNDEEDEEGYKEEDFGNDSTVFVTDLDTVDLLFDPFYGHVWYGITQGYPESAFAYRVTLRESMMSGGIYGADSYATLRLRVALALPGEDGKPGNNNSISSLDGGLFSPRVGWEPYDRFLKLMGLDTGYDHAANYEPYFLEGLMNTDVGKNMLMQAKSDYLDFRSLGPATDAEILEYLIGTCTGCGGG
jgi:RHS repeat-associated protein